MYRSGEKKAPVGMASWFSIENWQDGNDIDSDSNPIMVMRTYHLTNYIKGLSKNKWAAIVKGALQM